MSWYWHSGREGYDEERDSALITAPWRILHIRSNELLPTQYQLRLMRRRQDTGQVLNTCSLENSHG